MPKRSSWFELNFLPSSTETCKKVGVESFHQHPRNNVCVECAAET